MRRPLALASLLLLLLGCDDPERAPPQASPPPPAPPSALESHCASYAATVCAALERCWPNRLGKPAAVCREERSLACIARAAMAVRRVAAADRLAAGVRSLAAGRSTFDAVAAKACLDRLAAVCGPEFPGAACTAERFVRPALALGAHCRGDYECTGGFCRYLNTTDCAGTCVPFAGPDEECENDRECGSAGFCARPDFLCSAYAGLDGSCAGATCRPGLVCHADKCVTPIAAGADCGTDTHMQCAAPATCRRDKCIAVGEDSDTCAFGSESMSCGAALYCETLATFRDGACAPRLASGASCFLAFDCAPGLVCLGATFGATAAPGRCGAPVGMDGVCNRPPASWVPSECGPAACTTTVCAPWLALGAACDQGDDRCPAGSRCHGAPPTCQPDRGQHAGEDCGFVNNAVLDCGPDSYCVFVPGKAFGSCVARRGESAQCGLDSECLSERCIGRACAPVCPQ